MEQSSNCAETTASNSLSIELSLNSDLQFGASSSRSFYEHSNPDRLQNLRHAFYGPFGKEPKVIRSSVIDRLYRRRTREDEHRKSFGGDNGISLQDQYMYIRDIYRSNFSDLACPSPDHVKNQARVLLRRFLTHEPYEKYRHKSNKSTKDAKWWNEREIAFFEGNLSGCQLC
jgi:hypothetical protein